MKKKLIAALSLSILLCACGMVIEPSSTSSETSSEESIESTLPASSDTSSSSEEESVSSSSSEPTSDAFFELGEDKKSFTLIACTSPFARTYEVPSLYQGLPVTGIKKTAFAEAPFISELIIPNSVTYIEKGTLAPIASAFVSLKTPFIGETADATDSYLGMMFGIGDIVGKNLTSYYASNFATLQITNQNVIPSGAVADCDTLETIVVENCTEIGSGAFSRIEKLTSISLPDGLKKIGVGAFSGDSALASLSIPSSVTSIGFQAFSDLPFETFTLPASLESFDYSQDMPNLKEWIISNENESFTVTDGVLYSKDHRVLVNFPVAKDPTGFSIDANTREIGTHAFDKVAITSIDLSKISKIGLYAFNRASLEGVSFGPSLTSVGSSAFYGNESLASIAFPAALDEGNSLTLDNLVFAACTSLTSVTLPSYLTSIPNSIFASCSSLANVAIQGDLTYLGFLAFNKTKLQEAEITFADNASIGGSPFGETGLKTLTLHFVSGISHYPTIAITGLGATPAVVVDNEEEVAALKEAWANCPNAANLIQGKEVVSEAFSIVDGVLTRYDETKSTDPTRIIIPEGVTTISKGVFTNLSDIQYVYIPSSVTTIESNAFKNDDILEIEFGHDDPSTSLQGSSKLDSCINLKDSNGTIKTVFVIKDESKIAAFKARFNTSVLIEASSNIVLDAERKEIYNADKSKIILHKGDEEEYTFLDSVKEVGRLSFYRDENITSIDWNNVEVIDEDSFTYCTGLTELAFGEKITYIGDYAFSYHGALESISFAGATTIKEGAFYGDEEGDPYTVTSLDFGDKVTSIEDNAFAYTCGELEVFIPSSCLEITTGAFDYFSESSGSIIYFENGLDTYWNKDDEDDYWADDFLSAAQDGDSDITVAFYKEEEPTDEEKDLSVKFWHYGENHEKVLYE